VERVREYLKRLWLFFSDPQVYWRLFSLALALILWLLAAGEGDIGGTERFYTLPLTAQNLPADQALLDPLPNVKVRLRGLSPILSLIEDDLQAVIDLSHAEEGQMSYSVSVPTPVGVEVESISPQWVTVRTEQILTAEYPVQVGLLNIYPQALMHKVTPIPSTVAVTAPRSLLAQVDQVVAYISVGDTLGSSRETVPVVAIDGSGKPLQGVKLDPGLITLEIEYQSLGES
jgi:YbbR domain-containing protein